MSRSAVKVDIRRWTIAAGQSSLCNSIATGVYATSWQSNSSRGLAAALRALAFFRRLNGPSVVDVHVQVAAGTTFMYKRNVVLYKRIRC